MDVAAALTVPEQDDVPTDRRRWPRHGASVLRVGLVLLAGAVVVAYLSAGGLGGGRALSWIVAAVLLGLFSFALLRTSARRTRRRGPAQPPDTDVASSSGSTEDVSARALALQVRGLEVVLSEQEERLDEVRRAAGRRLDDALRRERQRARVTLEAIRDVVADQPGDVALNRLEAALGRIGEEAAFVRPLLCAAPSGGLPVTLGVPQDLAAEVAADPDAADPDAADPAIDPAAAADPAAVPPGPQPDVAAEHGRVMPVPAPPKAPATATSRGRLRRRRTAGSRS